MCHIDPLQAGGFLHTLTLIVSLSLSLCTTHTRVSRSSSTVEGVCQKSVFIYYILGTSMIFFILISYAKLSKLGKAAFLALGGRSFARIDIKLCANSLPHFVEANLMPGLSKGYFYRCCAMNLNMTHDEMILLLCSNRINSPSEGKNTIALGK